MTYEEAKMQIQAIPEKIWDQLSEPDREAMEMAFSALQEQDSPKPTAESAQNVPKEDLISRKAAIDVVESSDTLDGYTDQQELIYRIRQLPSAQPETHEERTETHACDLTNSQQAINLLKGLEQSLDDYCELNDEGKAAFRMAITALELFGNSEQLPSAQPEIVRCKECKYKYIENMVWSCPFGLPGGELFYCAYGAERRTDE